VKHDPADSDARRRRKAVAPITRDYSDISDEMVLWPFVTITSRPGLTTPVVSTDTRGYRLSRRGEETVGSDDAPADAGFVLGGSYAFGVGAADDSGTLPSALWRLTGKPYVNLGLRKATSTQELVAALPFAERNTTFVVCSGLNNFAVARAAPLDPLFGPTYLDHPLRRLQATPVDELVRLVKTVETGGRLAAIGDGDLRRELARRLRRRLPRSKPAAQPGRKQARSKKRPEPEPSTVVETAATIQLRDLRALRRFVPDEAEVVFALQPVASDTGKDLTEEERTLFDSLDVMQARTTRWPIVKALLETHWGAYAERLERGCADLGVPFVDLSRATYSGWCFVDRIHMTERGYETAATFLQEAMVGVAR
jgi:hypothetical protein